MPTENKSMQEIAEEKDRAEQAIASIRRASTWPGEAIPRAQKRTTDPQPATRVFRPDDDVAGDVPGGLTHLNGQALGNAANDLYAPLADVLQRAYQQAAHGKGKERHAGEGEAFVEQVIMDGAKRFGTGALLFQAYKKSEESQRLPTERGVNELLGAIVYLAAAVIRRESER